MTLKEIKQNESIRALRRERGMTQEQLAEQLGVELEIRRVPQEASEDIEKLFK